MKRIRLTRATVLLLLATAALVVAVAPALAIIDPYNRSFEVDGNNDGVPDGWIVRGRVLYDCDHPAKTPFGDCMMIFPANDDSRAAVFQVVDDPALVPLEESNLAGSLSTYAAAQNLQKNRVFFGAIFNFAGYSPVRVYGPLPYGSYGWTELAQEGDFFVPSPTPPTSMLVGYLAYPHYGSVAVDAIGWRICFNCKTE